MGGGGGGALRKAGWGRGWLEKINNSMTFRRTKLEMYLGRVHGA